MEYKDHLEGVGWGRGIEPGDVEGYVEHPEEGGEVEVVHDDGEGEALLPLHLHR